MTESLTATTAKESIGKRFFIKLPNDEGRRRKVTFNGVGYDTIKHFNEETEEVEGEIVSAHYSDCYLVSEQPEQLKQ